MSWADATGDPAAAYARELLACHGVAATVPEPAVRRSVVEDWAGSGAMALTGEPSGPPQLVAGAPATTARGALLALAALAREAGLDPNRLPDERLLGERAAVMGLARAGRVSAGGASRLLAAADGTVALTLSRPDDFAALPALMLTDELPADPWHSVAAWCRETPSATVVERAALLGLAAGAVDSTLPAPAAAPVVARRRPRPASSAPLVVDLSALWAGPLCAHLLALLGARVVSVESVHRPDPTREVAPELHRLLREAVDPVVLDFTIAGELARLRDLLLQADIVIEASRPRALAQLGIDAEEVVAESGHCTWLSITGYGRAEHRIGYGDDVAASAGLLGTGSVFAGDAIADPLTGTHAALAALAGWHRGGAGVTEVTMYDVARAARVAVPPAEVVHDAGEWFVDDGDRLVPIRQPAARQVLR